MPSINMNVALSVYRLTTANDLTERSTMELDSLISDFKTDIGLKEQQLEELLSQNKEMVDIAEVLEQAAEQKKEDLSSLKQKLASTNTAMNSTQRELSQTLHELQQTKNKLKTRCEENFLIGRELENERNIVQNLKLQFESSQTTINILENENDELDRNMKKKYLELDNFKKALGECQKMLYSSEADVDASIKSKETLLKTFQELQNKHQVKCEELDFAKKELKDLRMKVKSLEGGKSINIHFLGRSIKGKL